MATLKIVNGLMVYRSSGGKIIHSESLEIFTKRLLKDKWSFIGNADMLDVIKHPIDWQCDEAIECREALRAWSGTKYPVSDEDY